MDRAPEPRDGPRLVTIGQSEAGQRIDNFLSRHLKGVPRSLIYRILRRGEVRVNKGRIRPDYRLQAGDQVRVPPVRTAAAVERRVPEAVVRRLLGPPLYEDDAVLVLDKPAGLAVHGGSGLAFGLIEALRQGRPELDFLELAHRLDRETSGCLLLAKSRAALLALQDQSRRGAMDKRYLALVAGAWPADLRTVRAPLRKNVLAGGERMVAVADDGRAAVSHVRVLERLPGATLVEVRLETGRTHQIRVHAAHVGHPLAGDGKYGDGEFNRRMRAAGLTRLFLHAHSLAFRHPQTGAELHLSTPLPQELEAVLNRLECE